MQLAEIGHLGSYNEILEIPVLERNRLYENFVSIHKQQEQENKNALTGAEG